MLHIEFQNLSKVVLKKEILIFFLLFLRFEYRTPWCRDILDPSAFIWTNLVKDHYAMQHNKLQAPLSQVVLKKIFEYFSMYFYGLNLGTPCLGPSWTLGPSFEKPWYRTTRQCYIPNFKHLSQVILKKKILEYFSIYFYGLNLSPYSAGPSWIQGPPSEQTW